MAAETGILSKNKRVCAPTFATANNQRQAKLADLFDQTFVIKRILVNVNTAPNAGAVCTNGDDAQAGFYTFKMLYPEVIGRGFANDNSLSSLLAISP
jgi:hypothetical protein